MKKLLKEPYYIFLDIKNFFKTSYKKPRSFLFNFIIDYQSYRINIDMKLTKLYQKKFLNLEKNEERKKKLLQVQREGVIKIENFYQFENPQEIINLMNDKEKNKKILMDIINQNLKNLMEKILYYLSFMRGENYNPNQMRLFFQVNKDIDMTDEFHSDVFSHSPKGYIYLHNVDTETRPFMYLLKSHNDYKERKKLEKITCKNIYNETSQYMSGSSRLKENEDFKKYFDKFETFVGLAKKGDIIFADTSGFHKKGPGSKPRYAFWIEPKRGNLIKKLISFFFLKKHILNLKI